MGDLNRNKTKQYERYQMGRPEEPYAPVGRGERQQRADVVDEPTKDMVTIVIVAAIFLMMLVIVGVILWIYLSASPKPAAQEQITTVITQPTTSTTIYYDSTQATATTIKQNPTTTTTQPQANVIHVGQSQNSILGQTVVLEEIIRVKKYKRATNPQGKTYDEAEDGSTYLLAKVKVTYSGADKMYARRPDFRLKGPDGNVYSAEEVLKNTQYNPFPYISELTNGQTTVGYIKFEIPENSQGESIYYVGGTDETTGQTQYYKWQL